MHEKSEIMEEVVVSVLEKLAYMFADQVPSEEMPGDAGSLLRADIYFVGSTSGQLTLISSEEMCNELSVNMLGVEPGELDDQGLGREALKELLNVICGQLLTEILGDKPVFDLSAPTVSQMDAVQWKFFCTDSNALSFMVDENPVLLRLSMAA